VKIGFLGYGNMAEALASRWVGRHEIFIGGRAPHKAEALAHRLGASVNYGGSSEAVRETEIVVLATPHEVVVEAMSAAGGPSAFAGKTLIDLNNPVPGVAAGDFLTRSFDGKSLAEKIAEYAPEAHVVKAFNMCQASVWKLTPPEFDGRRLVVLYCGDDEVAKTRVAGLIEETGCRHVDLGGLEHARLLEPAAAIVIKLLFSGRDPHTVLNLIEPEVG